MSALQRPTLHYEVHPGDGPHLLLVHGMLSGRSHWLPNLRGLREFTTPVVVELFGHGRSPSPEQPERYHSDRMQEIKASYNYGGRADGFREKGNRR